MPQKVRRGRAHRQGTSCRWGLKNACLCLALPVQGEAIAHNLREMFGLRVPTISVVIGEGGSGGALAIGCCNKMLMLENAVYYVARYASEPPGWQCSRATPACGPRGTSLFSE